MTLVTPSLVFCLVSTESTSILMLQTLLLSSTTLSVTRAPLLTTQVSSTAHMYPSRWYVQLARTPSNPRSASRPVMVLLQTPSQKEPSKVWVASRSTRTVTTEEFRSRTSCDPLDTQSVTRDPKGSLFLYLFILM